MVRSGHALDFGDKTRYDAKGSVPHFVEEGGLSSRSQWRYVYKHCPYIKVDVEFSTADDQPDESPNDTIVKISRPYLEYSIFD